MSAVVYNQSLASLQIPDGLVFDVTTPTTGILVAANINKTAHVGTATWGQFDTRQVINSPRDQLRLIGPQTVGNYDLGTVVNFGLSSGLSNISVVRVGDTTQTAAILPISGATHPIAVLTGLYPGSYVNIATAKLTWNAQTPASLQQLTGNASKAYIDFTIYPPNGTPEVYSALDGNLLGGGTYSIDGPTLGAAIIAAVNSGQTNGRGPSQWFVASAGPSSPGAPVMNTSNVVTTLGTDGTTFASTPTISTQQLGSNGTFPYTGMYALTGGISGAALSLVGNSSLATVLQPALAFAKSANAHYVGAVPNGQSTTTGTATKTAFQPDWAMTIMDGNWALFTDAVNGSITRTICTASAAAIRLALTNVPNSPANLPMPLITGTQRVNSSVQPNPYTDGEKIQLENAGINFWTNDTAGNVGFALAHNKNSLGKVALPAYTGNIAYGRVIQFTIATFDSPLIGRLVGLTQGFVSADDVTRKKASALANAFIQTQIRDNIYDAGSVAVCNLTNNHPGRGILQIDLKINQREVIDIVAVGVLSGLNVVTAVNPGQVSP